MFTFLHIIQLNSGVLQSSDRVQSFQLENTSKKQHWMIINSTLYAVTIILTPAAKFAEDFLKTNIKEYFWWVVKLVISLGD